MEKVADAVAGSGGDVLVLTGATAVDMTSLLETGQARIGLLHTPLLHARSIVSLTDHARSAFFNPQDPGDNGPQPVKHALIGAVADMVRHGLLP